MRAWPGSVSLASAVLLLAGCAADLPDPRQGFSQRNVGQTLVNYVEGLGTQAVYLAPKGEVLLWTAARPGVQRGDWRFEPLVAGEAATYRGTAGINYPAEELAAAWRICMRYRGAPGGALPGKNPPVGDWKCVPLNAYEKLIVERAGGDVLGLLAGAPPGVMPAGRRLSLAALRAL